MVALLTVLAFLVMTMPIATVLVLMGMQGNGTRREWGVSSYQPMEILTARASTKRAETQTSEERAA